MFLTKIYINLTAEKPKSGQIDGIFILFRLHRPIYSVVYVRIQPGNKPKTLKHTATMKNPIQIKI